jgi:hypothetical protein
MDSPNDKLRKARISRLSPTGSGRPLSRQELADAVNAELARRGVRHAAIDAGHIGKFERGRHRWPQQIYRDALRIVLNVGSDADLGFFITRGRQNPTAVPSAVRALSALPATAGTVVPDAGHLNVMITAGSALGPTEIRVETHRDAG